MLTDSRDGIPYPRGMITRQNAVHAQLVPARASGRGAAMAFCTGEDEDQAEGAQVRFAIVSLLAAQHENMPNLRISFSACEFAVDLTCKEGVVFIFARSPRKPSCGRDGRFSAPPDVR